MQMGTGFWLVAGAILLALGSGMFLANCYQALVSPFGRRIDHLTMVLLTLYPIGVGFKATLIGPEFLRFHLSDIGFPVFVGFMLYHHFRSGFEKNNPDLGKDQLADMAQELRQRKMASIIGLGVSYAYECFAGLLYRLRPDMEVQLVGDFDWWDIVNYTLGAVLCYMLLVVWQIAVRNAQQAAAHVQRRKSRPGQRQQPSRRSRRDRRR